MAEVRMTRRPERLREPAMVCAFTGWNDGGEAATSAAAYLRDRWEATRIGDIDPEGFLDFQVTRPTVRLVDGVTRTIDWPSMDLYHAALPDRDVILFLGIEPNVRWRTFTEVLLGVAHDLGVGTVVALGAFLADVPHTLDTPVTGSAPDPDLAAELGMSTSRYEGPTGIVGILQDAAVRAGLRGVSLWAAVPHYLPGGPNPRASLALVEKAAAFLGVPVDTDTLARASRSWADQISEGIADNAELQAYVQRLEAAAADREGPPIMPSGDDLAAELERFLRDQRGESSS
jgi:predicted ATP-grasp superfamily ATP-dependent carboligase